MSAMKDTFGQLTRISANKKAGRKIPPALVKYRAGA
jgi:hypothetical protein